LCSRVRIALLALYRARWTPLIRLQPLQEEIMSAAVTTRPAIIGAAVWLAAATVVGTTGALAALRAAPLVLGVLLTVVAVVVTSRVPSMRQAIDAIPVRALVGVHAVRFIGIVFLALAVRGQLSQEFGQRAGWGDIVVAALAVALALIGPGAGSVRRWVFLTWNTLGMFDLLAAVGTAALVIGRGDSPGMDPLLRLPLLLVPIFAVPVLLATHVALFRRLSAG